MHDACAKIVLLCAVLLACPKAVAAQHSEPPLYIYNVNIVPMDREHILHNSALLVEDGQITAIGATGSVVVPDGTVEIDGQGDFIIPGLWDMHVHLMPDPEDPDNFAYTLETFVRQGVTSIRVMWGWPELLDWKQRIASGEVLGPRLVVGGPIIEGEPPPELAAVIPVDGKVLVKDSTEGALEVAAEAAIGYDFIKVYNNIPADAYKGIMAESRVQGLAVDGHVPFDVGLEGALTEGQRSIEHLRGYVWHLVPEDAENQPGRDLRSRTLAWSHADLSKIDELARWTLASGVWNCPTMAVRMLWAPQEDIDAYLASEEGQLLTPAEREYFTNRTKIPWLSNFSEEDFRAAYLGLAVQDSLVRALAGVGARLLAGTDTNPLGYVLHRELRELVLAGLTPFQALEAATANPADFLGLTDGSGTVVVGSRADLVLIEGNPLVDIGATSRIAGVVQRGRWIERDLKP